MDFISTLCIVAFALIILVGGFIIWSSFKFAEYWNQLLFIKRRRLLTLSMLIQYGLCCFCGVPIVVASVLSLHKSPNSHTAKTLRTASFFAYSVLINPVFVLIQYIYIARVWLLYYDMLLSKIQKNRQWRMIIDPKKSNKIDNESKFALKNQNTLYKTKSVFKICMIAFIIEYIIIGYPIMLLINVLTNDAKFNFISNGGRFLLAFFTLTSFTRICFGLYFWRKMHRLNLIDNFGIRTEIGYVWIHCICGILSFVCLLLANALDGLVDLSQDFLDAVTRLTIPYFGIMFTFSNIYMVFIYPIRVYNKTFNDKSKTAGNDAENVKYGESIKHWTQIIQTEVGYEEFMDYLATEFSTENLLFITEYIEVKKVLMDHFTHILDKLKDEHTRDCGFFVEFATLGSDEYENLETRANLGVKTLTSGLGRVLFSSSDTPVESPDGSGDLISPPGTDIAQSLIARQLTDALFNNLNDDNGLSYNKENTIAVGDCIIRAFSCLYCKYVDDYGASFMINISHRNRQSLLKLFDYKYYQKWESNLKSNNADGSSDESVIKQVTRERDPSIFVKLRNIASNKQELNDNNNDKDGKMTMANYLLRNDIVSDIKCNTKEEFETKIASLLHLLMKDTEKAVKEVSNLMQDSFFRFRREKKHWFQYMIKSSSPKANV